MANEKNLNTAIIAEIAGHASTIKTTQRYLHGTDDAKFEAVAACSEPWHETGHENHQAEEQNLANAELFGMLVSWTIAAGRLWAAHGLGGRRAQVGARLHPSPAVAEMAYAPR